jgi:hypothetical protein
MPESYAIQGALLYQELCRTNRAVGESEALALRRDVVNPSKIDRGEAPSRCPDRVKISAGSLSRLEDPRALRARDLSLAGNFLNLGNR